LRDGEYPGASYWAECQKPQTVNETRKIGRKGVFWRLAKTPATDIRGMGKSKPTLTGECEVLSVIRAPLP